MTRSLFAMAACCALLAGCNEAEDAASETYVRAHTTQQLMANVVQPNADVYWNTVKYVSDENGDHDILPESDEDWNRARNAAVTISEMGNLLMTPLYAEGRGDDWMQFSRSLVEAGQRAEKAAADHDVDAVFETGGTVYSVCSACHQVYPPEGGLEPPVGDTEPPAA